MDHAIRKAEALIEALPYIQKYRGRVTVLKLGGSVMESPSELRGTLQDIVFLSALGARPVLVHGGGKAIDRAMAEAGLVPRKTQGRRYTDRATLDVVVRCLIDEVNAEVVRGLVQLGGRAVGLHRPPLPPLHGEKLLLSAPEGPIDLGHVGSVTHVDRGLIESFAAGGVIPVIPSLALDADGGWLNVNADTAAAAVAIHLGAEKVVFLSDTPGVLRNRHDPGSLIPSLTVEECRSLIREKVIDDGMIPKAEACLEALQGGVKKAHLIDGRVKHSLLLEIFTSQGVGTEVLLEGQP